MNPHSPLPWTLFHTTRHARTGGGRNTYLLAEDGAFVSGAILHPADAAFILQAVNGHDALVDALRAVLADTYASHWHDHIRGVLARVEGQ